MIRWRSFNISYENSTTCTRLLSGLEKLFCEHMLHAWNGGGGGVQGFRLKSRDFGQPVKGSALSRLASMPTGGVIAL